MVQYDTGPQGGKLSKVPSCIRSASPFSPQCTPYMRTVWMRCNLANPYFRHGTPSLIDHDTAAVRNLHSSTGHGASRRSRAAHKISSFFPLDLAVRFGSFKSSTWDGFRSFFDSCTKFPSSGLKSSRLTKVSLTRNHGPFQVLLKRANLCFCRLSRVFVRVLLLSRTPSSSEYAKQIASKPEPQAERQFTIVKAPYHPSLTRGRPELFRVG